MVRYECLYSTGRQFVFTERPRLIFVGFGFLAFVGLIIGICLGVTLSLADLLHFEIACVGLVCFLLYRMYYFMFARHSSTLDFSSFCIALLTVCGFVFALLAGARWVLELGLDAPQRILVFGVVGLMFGIVIHGFLTLWLQEDERKHHIGLCEQVGSELSFSRYTSPSEADEQDYSTVEGLTRFMIWILSWQWWHDLSAYDDPDLECLSDADQIVVHNRSLKLVKVCFYAADDLFCWVPFGGVSGRFVGFIHAEQRRTFKLPRQRLTTQDLGAKQAGRSLLRTLGGAPEASAGWKLKVFQPGLFDKELACFAKAQCGQSLAFFDVEGMVRRSRLLCAKGSVTSSRLCGLEETLSESSEDEQISSRKTGLVALVGKAASSGSFDGGAMPRVRNTVSMSLKRNMSDGVLRSSSPSRSSKSSWSGTGDEPNEGRAEVRRAALDEVVLQNRSSSEIRASLFRSTDFVYMVPIVGCLVAPGSEGRLKPTSVNAEEYTLKVYSVGSASKELTYLTVSRGQTYIFSDSLLS